MATKLRSPNTTRASAEDIWDLGPITEKKSTQEIKDELRKGW